MLKVFIIIVNWNRKNDTIETLESLSKSEVLGFQYEIVVVDNASTDGSVSAINKLKLNNVNIKIIKNKTNLAFAEGNNIGMKYALKQKGDHIILLNNDTLVDSGLIVNLVEASKKYKKAGAISPKIYFAKGFEYHKNRYKKSELGKVIWYAGGDMDWDNIYGSNHGVDEVDKGQHNKVKDTDFATGACVLYPAKVLKDVGLFDERYFMYLEDGDLSQRIKDSGYRVIYYPKAKLWHKVAQSSGIGSDLNDYFITRNRLLFATKFARVRAKLAIARQSIKLLVYGRKWQKVGVKDFYLRNFGRGSWK